MSNPLVPVVLLDVHYAGAGARAAAVVASSWTDPAPIAEYTVNVAAAGAYQPGEFFRRELPCLMEVLAAVREQAGVIVVDGYVELDAQGAPGLGAHLYERMGGRCPVVGVAKTAYRGGDFAAPVLRGASQRPLFVTARGVTKADAAGLVRSMHGEHRVPTLIRFVDALARAAT
jgi:deoxyribonuclease V